MSEGSNRTQALLSGLFAAGLFAAAVWWVAARDHGPDVWVWLAVATVVELLTLPVWLLSVVWVSLALEASPRTPSVVLESWAWNAYPIAVAAGIIGCWTLYWTGLFPFAVAALAAPLLPRIAAWLIAPWLPGGPSDGRP